MHYGVEKGKTRKQTTATKEERKYPRERMRKTQRSTPCSTLSLLLGRNTTMEARLVLHNQSLV